MESRILITGSNGFFGNQILEIWDKSNVYTLSRVNANFNVDLSKEIPSFNIYFESVIHCAGKAHSVPKNQQEIQEFHNVNVKGTQNLLRGLEYAPKLPKSFVFISSVAVYGLGKGIDVCELHPLNATDAYGASKIEAERIVAAWCKENGVICTILRLPLLVGPNPPGNLLHMINGIRGNYYFNIAGGTAKKSMVLAQDVAKFIPVISPIGGTYNLTDGEHPTFLELSKAIAKSEIPSLPLFVAKIFGLVGDLIGNKAPINSFKINKIIYDLTFDDSKARLVGWKSQSVLEYLMLNDLVVKSFETKIKKN